MSSLGVALPLRLDPSDGFTMIKGFKKLVKQNLKMLILTIPGERVMMPNYGVGLKKYLFSNYHDNVYSEIQQKISEQVNTYMPAVKIEDVQFDTSSPDTNTLGLRIIYSIPQVAVRDSLQFTI